MQTKIWFNGLSKKQRAWLACTVVVMMVIGGMGVWLDRGGEPVSKLQVNTRMSIREIAPQLKVTGKNLARELDLPLDVAKQRPLQDLGISEEALSHSAAHLLSHQSGAVKYFVFLALVLGGLVFLLRLGRPDASGIGSRNLWYPRAPYIVSLLVSVLIAGFWLGKSPNPMEGAVKVLKSMIGLYPDPLVKAVTLGFFLVLAIVGNKMICGWACPFGALQELLYSLPFLKSLKRKKIPFVLSNTVRGVLLILMLFFMFGIIGKKPGLVLYHYLNPFNLFNLEFESFFIALTVAIVLPVSLAVYRPFCQFICPFGLLAWVMEHVSLTRVKINADTCTKCGACVRACPLQAAEHRVKQKKVQADCFSCFRCLNVCPVDAISYESVFKKEHKKTDTRKMPE